MRCQHPPCAAVIGATDGENLFIRGVPIPFQPLLFGWNCPECRRIVRWQSKHYKKTLQKSGK